MNCDVTLYLPTLTSSRFVGCENLCQVKIISAQFLNLQVEKRSSNISSLIMTTKDLNLRAVVLEVFFNKSNKSNQESNQEYEAYKDLLFITVTFVDTFNIRFEALPSASCFYKDRHLWC